MSSEPHDVFPSPNPPVLERLASIDALRGFDMFWIVGGDEVARALGKWWGGPHGERFAEQFEHVDWEGFRFYDLIFPLFLFVVGVVLPFSLRKYTTGDHPRSAPVGRIVRRVVLLFFCGLLYNNLLQFHFDALRITGVLQRIAICYGAAALLYLFLNTRTRVILFVAILLGYWALFALVPSPKSQAGDYTKDTNLAGYIDQHYLPGKMYRSYGDNEGLLSTIPAVATALLGVFAGEWLLSNRGKWLKALGLALAGLACLGLGTLWGHVFPVVKILWTSSYVLIAGGWSLILLSLFYTIIDVIKLRAWAFFFIVIGMNAITIYLATHFIPFDDMAREILGGVARYSGEFKPVVIPLGVLALEWLLLYHLYRNRVFLRV